MDRGADTVRGKHSVRPEHLVRGAAVGSASWIEEEQVSAGVQCEAEIVDRREDDPPPSAEPAHDLLDGALVGEVERARRFVEHDNRSVLREHARKLHELALPPESAP